jgi:hypothetical protein
MWTPSHSAIRQVTRKDGMWAMILVPQEAGGKGGKVRDVLRLAGWPVSTVRGTTDGVFAPSDRPISAIA